jgi:hypothetical protein
MHPEKCVHYLNLTSHLMHSLNVSDIKGRKISPYRIWLKQDSSYKMGTGSFLGLKRPGRGVNHPLHVALRLKEE